MLGKNIENINQKSFNVYPSPAINGYETRQDVLMILNQRSANVRELLKY